MSESLRGRHIVGAEETAALSGLEQWNVFPLLGGGDEFVDAGSNRVALTAWCTTSGIGRGC